jgi:hypothetical protein
MPSKQTLVYALSPVGADGNAIELKLDIYSGLETPPADASTAELPADKMLLPGVSNNDSIPTPDSSHAQKPVVVLFFRMFYIGGSNMSTSSIPQFHL